MGGEETTRVGLGAVASYHEDAQRKLNNSEWPIRDESRELNPPEDVEDTRPLDEYANTGDNWKLKTESGSSFPRPQPDVSDSTLSQAVQAFEEHQVAGEIFTGPESLHLHYNTVEYPFSNKSRPLSRTIHILGSGNIGKLVAHSLAGLAEPPPITLLLHRPLLIQQWYDEGEAIEIISGDDSVVRRGFSVELATQPEAGLEERYPGFAENILDPTAPPENPIDNLVVTTKAAFTVPALLSIRRRLHSGSTICFIQNGMGIIEDVSKHVFPDPANRPRYMAGTTTHGVAAHDARQFAAFHNGVGTTSLSVTPVLHHALMPRGEDHRLVRRSSGWTNSTLYMARMLTRPTALDARGYPYVEFMQSQLEKLAVNCVINPLTSMYDCTNGDLLFNFAATRSFRKILEEFCQVVRKLPELQGIEGVEDRFRKGLLEKRVVSIAEKTSTNTSSMLQDIRKGRKTEIDYINGYIMNRARQIGVACPVNSLMVQMIKAKQAIKDRQIKGFIPFDGQRRGWG